MPLLGGGNKIGKSFIFLKIITNIIYNITRDNTSFNDTLISKFVQAYNKQSIKFQRDITYFIYILNIFLTILV